MLSYLITNNKGSYIRYDEGTKKYVTIKNKNFATSWESRAKAKNILNNSIPKSIRREYRVVEDGSIIDNPTHEPVAAPVDPVDVQETYKLHIDDVKRIANSEIIEHKFDDWVNGMEQIEEFFVSASDRKEELLFEMSAIDREISDIEHYIELKGLNAYQGWMACKMLQNRLRQRRKIKDELTIISQIAGCSISKAEIREVQDIAAHITEGRKYEPRVLTELFS